MACDPNTTITTEKLNNLNTNIQVIDEVVTSDKDLTDTKASDGEQKLTLEGLKKLLFDTALPNFLPPVTSTQGQTDFFVGTGLSGVQVNRNGTIEQVNSPGQTNGSYSYNPSTGIVTLNEGASIGESFQFGFNLLPGGAIYNSNLSGIYFPGVDSMKAGQKGTTTVDIAALAEDNEYVNTMYYSNFENGGGATYRLSRLDSYRVEIGDPSWVPNEYRDHYLLGGVEYIAILVPELIGVEHCAQWGVIVNDELPVTTDKNADIISAMNEFLCPYQFDTDVKTTYFDKALAGGVIQLSRGFTCTSKGLPWNPHVEYRGLNPIHRINGKVNPSAGDQLAFVKYTGPEADIYVIDTSNYKDLDPSNPFFGIRNTDSKSSFFNSSIDAMETAYSEGSFLRNVGIIAGNAVGGFRLVAGMKGGYDGVAVSGGIVSYMLSNCFNVTLGSIWTEESIYSRLGFENTNLRFFGQTTSVGNFSTKGQATDAQLARLPIYFGSNFATDDDYTLPLVHLKQSKAVFAAFEWDTVYENFTTEFFNNPICAYSDGVNTSYVTIKNWSEEANNNIETIDGNVVQSVLVTGFNVQVRLHEMHSISNAPVQALGINSVIYVTAAKRWVGDSFYPDYMDERVRGNPFIIEEIRTLSPRLRRDHNVSIRGLKRDITFYCDDDTGSDVYFGLSPQIRGKVNNIFEGIVQSSDVSGNFSYKPVNQTHEITLAVLGGTNSAIKDHKVGNTSTIQTAGLSDGVRMRIIRDGDGTTTADGTRLIKASQTFDGPILNNVDILFEGVALRNDNTTQPGLESNGLFRISGLTKIEMKQVTCQQNDTQGDGAIFTCLNGTYVNISYRDGNMIAVPKGLFDVVSGSQAVIDGIITSGVNAGKSSNNPVGLTDRVVNA